jgi:hypothetical protein
MPTTPKHSTPYAEVKVDFPITPIERIESGIQRIPLVGPYVRGRQCSGTLIIYWNARNTSVVWDYGDIHQHHEASTLFEQILEGSGWLAELMRRLKEVKFGFDFDERLHMPWQSLKACPSEIACWCSCTLPGVFKRSADRFAEIYIEPEEEEVKETRPPRQRPVQKRVISYQKTKPEIVSPAPAEQRPKTPLRTVENGSD